MVKTDAGILFHSYCGKGYALTFLGKNNKKPQQLKGKVKFMMVENKREEIKTSILNDVGKFSGDTIWGDTPNAKVIELGKKFCEELAEKVDVINDDDKAFQLSFFSDVLVPPLVAGTRSYEDISDEELEAFSKIFDDLRAVVKSFVDGCDFGIIFEKTMYVQNMFITNAISREDFDCKYRQYMIFPSYCDVYEIVHRVMTKWDKLIQSEDFLFLFINYRKEWYRMEVNSDYYGDYIMDKIHGWKGPRPVTAMQVRDPRYWGRKFIEMLDERINK